MPAMHPFYVIRALGGLLFILGYTLMIYNIWMTIRMKEEPVNSAAFTPSFHPAE